MENIYHNKQKTNLVDPFYSVVEMPILNRIYQEEMIYNHGFIHWYIYAKESFHGQKYNQKI